MTIPWRPYNRALDLGINWIDTAPAYEDILSLRQLAETLWLPARFRE